MKPFTSFESRMVPLPINNVDTDQIIPARFLKTTDKEGLGQSLFADWRYDGSGRPKPDFALNQPRAASAQVLLAGDNFGCGSSREHAPWALKGFGFQAVVSTSFADIFKNNALKNGLLPVAVEASAHRSLLAQLERAPEAQVTIDLASQTLRLPDGARVTFPVDGFSKTCLLEGVDELGYIQRFSDRIAEYEKRAVAP